MKLTTFLRTHDLERSLLVGYYGGGNYGDELLLEVLQNLLSARGVQRVTIAYQDPSSYTTMHHDLGYKLMNMRSKKELVMAALRNKTILVGGGGLWGVDMNMNTFLLSVFLFACRCLGKKVFLLGVGYYNSTTRLGRAGAWLAGKAANLILARDAETYDNFRAISKRVRLDADIAWYVGELDLRSYDDEVVALEGKLRLKGKTIFFAPRRWQSKQQRDDFVRLNQLIGDVIAANRQKRVILALVEAEAKDPELYAWARKMRAEHTHMGLLDFAHNPLTLFLFFRKHHKDLAVIAPQLHLIITAYLTNTLFAPIVYDNKVSALLTRIGVTERERLPIRNIDQPMLQQFIDEYWGGLA